MRLRDKMLTAAGVRVKGDHRVSSSSSSSSDYSTGSDFDSDCGVESTTVASTSADMEVDTQFKHVVDSDCYSDNEEPSSRMSRLVTLLFMAIALEAGVVTLFVRSYWPRKGFTTSSFIGSPPEITCCRYDRFYSYYPVSGHCVLSDALQKECDVAVETLYELYTRREDVVCESGAYYNHSIVLSSTEYPLLTDLLQIDSNCLPNSLKSTGIGCCSISLSQISYDKLQKPMSWSYLKKSIKLAFYYCVATFVILLLATFVFDEWRRRRLEKATLQTKLINATYQTLVEHAKHSPLDPLPVDILQHKVLDRTMSHNHMEVHHRKHSIKLGWEKVHSVIGLHDPRVRIRRCSVRGKPNTLCWEWIDSDTNITSLRDSGPGAKKATFLMDTPNFLIWNGLILGAGILLGVVWLNLRRLEQKGTGGNAGEGDNEKARRKESAENAPRGPLRIYFGSQTGTAEAFAKNLEHEGKRLGFGTYLVDLEDWDPKQIEMPSQCVPSLFVMATFGEGDPTDNATEFFIWLGGDKSVDEGDKECEEMKPKVPQLKYAVFGLGNSQYESYNHSGKRTNRRLELRGGIRMAEYGEGNEDANLDEDFDAWREKLWPQVCEVLGGGSPESTIIEDKILEEPVFSLNYISDGHSIPRVSESNSASSTRFFWHVKACRVLDTVELKTGADVGSTKHVVLDLKGTGLNYTTADNIAVCPENPKEMVNLLCRSQGYDPEACFTMDMDPSHKAPFPTPCTVAECLTSYVDIMAIPRALVLASLVSFATDSSDRERLRHLSSREGRDDYRSFILDQKRCIGELLCCTFRSIRIPLNHLLNIVPPPHPREYTGANGGKSVRTEVHLAVSVLEKTLDGGREWKGLCSSFLANLKPGEQCRIIVRPSGFCLPSEPDRPVILIGPGTGIAPMRALLQDLQQMSCSGLRRRTWLYFGCRNKLADYLYHTDLENFVQDKTLTKLRTAFSRDQPQKIYVQHLLEQDGYDIFQDLYERNGHLYVCGGTAMGANVATLLSEVCMKHGNMDDAGTRAFISALHQEGRYIQELWS